MKNREKYKKERKEIRKKKRKERKILIMAIFKITN